MTQKEFLKVTKNCFEKCGCISDRKRFVYDADKLYVVFILLRSNYSDCYYIDYNFSIKALHPKFTLKDDSLDFILQPRLTLINDTTEFLFLQLGFYTYIFEKFNNSAANIFKICLQFLNPKTKFTSILDYVFLNKDSDAESSLTANLLTFLPGTIGILMKKRYLIVHSLDKDYFSLSEMYNITTEVGKIDDDSLV